jgi:hypothetical protein
MKRQPEAIEKFLEVLTAQVRSKSVAQEVREEIVSHLEDSVEHLTGLGLPEEEAIDMALLKLGNPLTLGREIQSAKRPWFLRWSLLAPTAIFSFAIVGVFILHSDVNARITASTETFERTQGFFDRFMEDRIFLSREEFFSSYGRASDAGLYLNPRVRWEGKYQNTDLIPEIAVPSDLLRHLKKIGAKSKKTIFELADDPVFDRLDMSWMKQLFRFDHWDLTASPGPAKSALGLGEPLVALASVDYNSLSTLAQIRVLRGLKTKDLLPALREIRQLAKLIYSNETLISSMVATGILATERNAYEEGLRRGLLKPGQWKPVSAEQCTRARRLVWASGMWFSPLAPESMLRGIFLSKNRSQVQCAGIFEGSSRALLARKFLLPKVPMESDFTQRYALLENILKQQKLCRSSAGQIAFAMSPETEPPLDGYFYMPDMLWALGSDIPFLRRVLGLTMNSLADSSWLTLYDRESKDVSMQIKRRPGSKRETKSIEKFM